MTDASRFRCRQGRPGATHHARRLLVTGALALLASANAWAEAPPRPAYALAELVERARREGPAVAVSLADEATARAGLVTARAYPNPEVGFEWGRGQARGTGPSGESPLVALQQPIESPWLRDARARAAQQRVDVSLAQTGATASDLTAAVRRRFFEVARLREELGAYGEDQTLTEQIRDRVSVRVALGEGARFDLVRAESEVAVARKNVDTARLRLRQATLELRRLVGPSLEQEFDVVLTGDEWPTLADADLASLRDSALEHNPGVRVARQELARAESQVDVERQSVLPQLALRATQERDPSTTITRVGAFVTVPLLNRREGPIGEARAQAERARVALEMKRFEVQSALDAAWQGHRAASAQVRALEGGILERARTALRIAESAYQLGERGILEFLDAQRQFRLVRNELISARFEQHSARIEIERLAGR